MYSDSFIVHVKTEGIGTENIAKDVVKISDTSNYELEKLLPKRRKKSITLMKDKVGEKNMKEFIELKTKTRIYSADDNDETKKAKGTKNV